MKFFRLGTMLVFKHSLFFGDGVETILILDRLTIFVTNNSSRIGIRILSKYIWRRVELNRHFEAFE